MANYGPASAFLLVGGNDMRGDETWGLDEGVEQLVQEVRGLGDSMDAYKTPGVGLITLEAAPALYSDATFKKIAAYETAQNTRKLVAYGFAGTSPGFRATMIDGLFSSVWKRQAQRDGLLLAGATFTVSGTYLEDGEIVTAYKAIAGATNTEGASCDSGASSASGVTLDLHVSALDLSGGSAMTVTVQDSPDNVIWTLLGTFTNVTSESAGTAERITVAGSVDRYLSITASFTGGVTPTATVSVFARRG